MYRFCMSDNSWEMHSMINNGTGGLKWCLSCLKWEKWLTLAKLDKLNRAVYFFSPWEHNSFFWLLLPPPHFFFLSGILRAAEKRIAGAVEMQRFPLDKCSSSAPWFPGWAQSRSSLLPSSEVFLIHGSSLRHCCDTGELARGVWKESRGARWGSAPSKKKRPNSVEWRQWVLGSSFFRKGKLTVRVTLLLLEEISFPLSLLSFIFALHIQGHSRVPAPPSALLVVGHLGIKQHVSSDRQHYNDPRHDPLA